MDGRAAELIDLRTDNEMLRETIEEMHAGFDGLKPLLLDLVGPHDRSRPEVLIALQMLATFAGLPAGCDRRECRRDGVCHAKDPCEPACGAGWTDELFGRFSDMAAGISLSALVIGEEARARQTSVAPLLVPAAGRGAAKRGSAKRGAAAGPRKKAAP